MSKATDDFLRSEALALSVMAALAHEPPVYDQNALDKDREEVRRDIKCLVRCIGESYKDTVREEDHIENIKYISKQISNSHESKLHALPPCTNGRFRIGCAQKVLNLYLKYLWAFRWIPPPPHCPFDSVVLRKLGRSDKWKSMDDIGVYRAWVAAAKEKAGGLLLPDWEVSVFELQRSNKLLVRGSSRTRA